MRVRTGISTVIIHVHKCTIDPCIGCVWLLWGLMVPHSGSGSSKCGAGTNVGPCFLVGAVGSTIGTVLSYLLLKSGTSMLPY